MSRNGILFVISGPSGAGKGTLVKALMKRVPNFFLSISATTREPRFNERDGVDYYFFSENEFQRRLDEKSFLEWASLYGYRYGTLKEATYERLDKGQDVILEIDVQGARQIRSNIKGQAAFIFITPPSLEELKNRIKERRTESGEQLRVRLETAKNELKAADEFDYRIVNDDLNAAIDKLAKIVIKCRESKKVSG